MIERFLTLEFKCCSIRKLLVLKMTLILSQSQHQQRNSFRFPTKMRMNLLDLKIQTNSLTTLKTVVGVAIVSTTFLA